MEYTKKNLGSCNLHMIKTDKFKTITIQVILREEVKKEDITKRLFLTNLLKHSTKKYNTERKVALKSQELYGFDLYVTNARLGNYMNSIFTISPLEEKYTEEKMLDESIKFLNEILFNPNQNNNVFDQNSFDIIKKDLETEITGLKENTRAYSLIRMLESMDEEAPFSYRSYGYLEDLEKITPINLYEYYKHLLKTNLIDIYVLGNIDTARIEKLIKENFLFRTFRNERINTIIPCHNKPKSQKLIIEPEKVKQSKLVIGCRLIDLEEYERNYVLTLYNIIFGGGSDSKLFKEVREKNSLAYYIYSAANKLDNILIIQSGISKDKLNDTIKIIKQELKEMEKGNFTSEDIEIARNIYITSLNEINDNNNQILQSYYSMELLGTDDIETRKKKILDVSKEDIIAISKKVKIDTIYLLEGSEVDEEN